ncbi:hypothetical protein H7F36_13320 [Variovorax sp. PAMC28562]|uniref:hypothetical protein n=1 Tax=Variovorax sp. PAMC28562 TaxID=2762323 RepID=UPI00164D9FEE|nr:hypothetical protein [Variovorax sp. PAMC28562]QNK72211.1 hypothetical protein H7F36_13320 [Variovorax sp. PAMC28562]
MAMTMHSQISVRRCAVGVLGTVVFCAVIGCGECDADDGGGSEADRARSGNARLSTLAPIMNTGRTVGGYAKRFGNPHDNPYDNQQTSRAGRDLCILQNGLCTE